MVLLVLGLLVPAACSSSKRDEQRGAAAEVPTLTVDEVATLVDQKKAQVVDANSKATRERQGVIPGAILLSHYEKYGAAELPDDKSTQLVFYCANTECSASDRAAQKARDRGYENVAVLRAGIAGWREAGKPTDTL